MDKDKKRPNLHIAAKVPLGTITESVIKRHIVTYLKMRGVFCWVQMNVGIYDAAQGKYRALNQFGAIKGVADILGIYKNRPLAIEVKTTSGKLSEYQKDFLIRFAEAGGIAFVARSVDHVVDALEMADRNQI